MGRAREVIKQELMDLEPEDRAEVAEDAIRSLAGSSYGELSPAWEAEIDRRLRAEGEGSAKLIPRDDVFGRSRLSCGPAVPAGKKSHRFNSVARADLRNGVLWYEERRDGFGERFAAQVRAAIDLIVQGPDRWPVRRARAMKLSLSPWHTIGSIRRTGRCGGLENRLVVRGRR
jgi:putative addiction module component (TIGR02574 family)